MFKKVVAFLLAAVMLATMFTLTGCKKSFKIENEKDAKKVYSFPLDNKFGLERIAVFDDRAVVVLDKKICDSFEDLDIRPDQEFPNREEYFFLDISNRNHPYPDPCTSEVEVTEGKYVVTICYDNNPRYKRTAEHDYEISGIRLGYIHIGLYYTSVEISCGGYNDDRSTWYFIQRYSLGKWQEPERGENPCSIENED